MDAARTGLIRYVPNVLTVLRLCALPVIVYLYSVDLPGSSWTTAIVILIAALSDVADGSSRAIPCPERVRPLGGPDRRPRLLLHDRGHALVLRHAAVAGRRAAAHPRRPHPGPGHPDTVYTTKGPEITRWGKASNFILICALQWFIVDIRVLGWAFFAVGATLYIASGLWYGYKVLVYVRAGGEGGASA